MKVASGKSHLGYYCNLFVFNLTEVRIILNNNVFHLNLRSLMPIVMLRKYIYVYINIYACHCIATRPSLPVSLHRNMAVTVRRPAVTAYVTAL